MKKITLKYYGYRDPAAMLQNALSLIEAKTKIKRIELNPRSKSVTFLADPYDAEALRTVLRKKYSVTLITNLPTKLVFFIGFLVKENFYDEYKTRAEGYHRMALASYLQHNDATAWPLDNWVSSAFLFNGRDYAINERYRIAATEFLTKNNY